MPAGLNARRALVRFLQRIAAITTADAPDLEATSEADFGAALERTSGLDAKALAERLVAELRIERFDPASIEIGVAEALPADLARRHDLVLVRLAERAAHVAMANPLDLDALKEVELAVRRRTHAIVATPAEIAAAQATVYPETTARVVEPVSELPSEPDAGVMTVVRACLDRIDELERRLERETLPPPPDPGLAARFGALETTTSLLRGELDAAQDRHRDDLARIAADLDALVAAHGAAQQQAQESQGDLVDAAVRRVGEVLLPRLDELAAGTLVAVDRAERAQRTADGMVGVIEEMRSAADAVDAITPLREAMAAQGAELLRLAQHVESMQRRTDGWAAASELRGLEAEVMALAAQLHRTAQGVEWARTGLADARNDLGRAHELAEGARRVAEAAVTATALDGVRETLDGRLRQVATQVARYEAGLGRLSGAQGELEEALGQVRAVAEESRRLMGAMVTIERATAIETSVAMLRAETNRIAAIVDAPAPSLFETVRGWAWRGAIDAFRIARWVVSMGRA